MYGEDQVSEQAQEHPSTANDGDGSFDTRNSLNAACMLGPIRNAKSRVPSPIEPPIAVLFPLAKQS